MNKVQNVYTLAEQIKDNIAAFGHFEAAKLLRKKVPFTLYHWLAFGYLPRSIVRIVPENDYRFPGDIRVLLTMR